MVYGVHFICVPVCCSVRINVCTGGPESGSAGCHSAAHVLLREQRQGKDAGRQRVVLLVCLLRAHAHYQPGEEDRGHEAVLDQFPQGVALAGEDEMAVGGDGKYGRRKWQ